MAIIIGSARADESYRYSGGKAGDQRQGRTPDRSGEVSMQDFYVHSKGWRILRPKSPAIAAGIAAACERACNNPHIGYSQSTRDGIVTAGTATQRDVNADCSSLVRRCVMEASGKDPGDFYTGNEVSVLQKTGLFEPTMVYSSGTKLCTGDVLVTKTKGHTVIVVQGAARITTGWVDIGCGKWQYLGEDGRPLTGWQALSSSSGRHWYLFGEDGIMLTGWQQVGGAWYYLDTTPGPDEGACWRSDSEARQSVWVL